MTSLKECGFIALDGMTHWNALTLAASLRGLVYGVKVEHLLFGSMSSMELICRLKEMGFKVFADAKLHSTPPAVAESVKGLARSGADLISVHASEGPEMIRTAVEAYTASGVRDARKSETGMGILALTVPTSLSEEACRFAHGCGVDQAVAKFASPSIAAGAAGIICSPLELRLFPVKGGVPYALVTPGIVSDELNPGRHKRYAPAAFAVAHGARYLVIGKDVTQAADPLEAIRRINESIAHLP